MTGESGKVAIQAVKQAQQRLSLYGKQAVVVGGTSGIGQAMAIRLAQANANVTIIGRNKQIGLKLVEEMKKASTTIPEIITKTSSASSPPKYSFLECDASLLHNVKQTSDHLQHLTPKIDYLICTQGIATLAGRAETKEGLEQKLALHYYSRYGFAYYLTNHLQKSADPRFISVFSGGIHQPYAYFQKDPDLLHHFSLQNMANATGMYNDFACEAMSQRYPSISFLYIAPGFIATQWGREMPFFIKPILSVLKRFARTKEDAAEYLSQTIFQGQFKAPGYFILNQYAQPAKVTPLQTKENVEFIWKHTENILNKYK